MPTFVSPEELSGMLAAAAEDYPKLKKDSEAAAARLEWSRGSIVPSFPFESEVDGVSPFGVPYTRAPLRPKPGDCETGFDTRGRPVLVREHRAQKGLYESFLHHDDTVVRKWHFSAPRKPISVVELRSEHGRVRSFVRLSPYGAGSKRFEYDARGRLVTLHDRTTKRGVYASKGDKPIVTKATLEYDDVGLVRVTKSGGTPKPVVVYQRPTRPLATVLRSLETELLRAIPLTVGRLRLRRPAFSLALVYDNETEQGVVPPMLAVGLEADRKKWRTLPDRNPELLWIPHALRTFEDDRLELDDPRVVLDGEEAVQHMRTTGNIGPGRRLLIKLAKALNALSWKGVLPTTKDFVVYAVDLGAEDLQKNMGKCVSEARLAELRRLGEL